MAYRRGRQKLRLQSQRTAIPVNLLKISGSCSSRTPSILPQISKMHHMMFFLFLIISPCMAIDLSLNEACSLANHTASQLNLSSPGCICINDKGWGYVQPIPGYQYQRPTLPAELWAVTQRPHVVVIWPFGERGKKNFMSWYQQQLSLFTPWMTSAIPPEPLFSLMTNIPQVTFPISLKSHSLTGVSVRNLDDSQCGVTVTVETDGKNRDRPCSWETSRRHPRPARAWPGPGRFPDPERPGEAAGALAGVGEGGGLSGEDVSVPPHPPPPTIPFAAQGHVAPDERGVGPGPRSPEPPAGLGAAQPGPQAPILPAVQTPWSASAPPCPQTEARPAPTPRAQHRTFLRERTSDSQAHGQALARTHAR